jgi:cyclopropane-fatty-acyl-phospholipid synthase
MEKIINVMERGWIPDGLTRWGIRQLIGRRLREESNYFTEHELNRKVLFASQMKSGPLALHTEETNNQHYELPSKFFELVLGSHKKYSGCFWGENINNLTQAEASSLAICCERAQIEDGMTILDLGCGWGSLSLWLAERYPKCQIVAVSNSLVQKKAIDEVRHLRNFNNLKVITHNMNSFHPTGQFDRVVSIEMFEHMRNYRALMNRIASWLKPDGKLFIHIFCHRRFPYFFETKGDHNWMGRYFFTGGVMPSFDLPEFFQEDLQLKSKWWWGGEHYQKTAEAWLSNMDSHEKEIQKLFRKIYGKKESRRWVNRWRIFFMACAEMFGYRSGREWGVSHYLFCQNPMVQ